MYHEKVSKARSRSHGVVARVAWLAGEVPTGVDDHHLFDPRMRDRRSCEKSEYR